MKPPRLACWLLERFLPAEAAEAIAGDLMEEFARRTAGRTFGSAGPRLWFWRQTIASIAAARFSPARRSHGGDVFARPRRAGVLDGLRQDVRFALRGLRRSPGVAATAIVTLAIGIGASTAIGTAASRALIRPLPYPNGDRLVFLGHPNPDGTVGNVGYETVVDWRARLDGFDELAIVRGWSPTLVTDQGATLIDGMRVTWNYFQMIGVRPVMGRDFTRADDDPDHWRVVMISDALWRRQFHARADIVGATITFNGRPYQVAGVLPASFEPLVSEHFFKRADVWAPLGYAIGGDSSCRSCQHLKAIGRLRAGVGLPQALAELQSVQSEMRRQHPADYAALAPVAIDLQDELSRSIRRPLQVLLGAVLFVLLVSSANVAGLLMARATGRAREFAVRSALGAGRLRLARQILTESFVLAAASAALGLGLARVGLLLLAKYVPVGLPRLDHAPTDPMLILVAAAAVGVALVIFGLLPASVSSRSSLESVLRDTRQASSRRSMNVREWLMAGQVAVALLLVAGTGLMYRTVDRLLHVNPGFNSHDVLSLNVMLVGPPWAEDSAVRAFQDELLRRVRALPGVESVALAGQIPLGGNYDRWGFHIDGRTYATDADAPEAERYAVTPDYFRVMNIPLKEGRLIDDSDVTEGALTMVINETAARTLWPGASPIGAHVRIGGPKSPLRTIVGVVGDVRHYALSEPPAPQMYLPQRQQTDSYLVLVARATSNPAALTVPIRDTVAAIAKDVPVYDVATLDERLDHSVATRSFLMVLLAVFAAATLVMAAVGLYGVVAQHVTARRREFGIRLALGAARRDISWLVLRRGLLFVALGVVAGVGSSAIVGRALESQLYHTSASDVGTLAVSVAILFVVAILAHVGPLGRATRVDPAIALRNE